MLRVQCEMALKTYSDNQPLPSAPAVPCTGRWVCPSPPPTPLPWVCSTTVHNSATYIQSYCMDSSEVALATIPRDSCLLLSWKTAGLNTPEVDNRYGQSESDREASLRITLSYNLYSYRCIAVHSLHLREAIFHKRSSRYIQRIASLSISQSNRL